MKKNILYSLVFFFFTPLSSVAMAEKVANDQEQKCSEQILIFDVKNPNLDLIKSSFKNGVCSADFKNKDTGKEESHVFPLTSP